MDRPEHRREETDAALVVLRCMHGPVHDVSERTLEDIHLKQEDIDALLRSGTPDRIRGLLGEGWVLDEWRYRTDGNFARFLIDELLRQTALDDETA